MGRSMSAWYVACVLGVVAAVAGTGKAFAKGGGGGGSSGTTVNTTGVVAFGDGTGTTHRGTYVMDPGGSGLRLLSESIYPMDVSRGASVVTVLLNGPAGAAQGLVATRADGIGEPVVLISDAVRVTNARFSFDGDHVAYQITDTTSPPYAKTIVVADVIRDASSNVTGLTNAVGVFTTSNSLAGLDFSRDGGRIVFAMSNGGTNDLWTVRVADGEVVQITSTSASEKNPRWSPVDDRIVCTRYANASTAVGDVVTIETGTGATRTVVAGTTSFYASEFACWAPDGGNLLFQASKKNVGIDLYQVPSSSSGSAVSVTSGAGLQETTPAWGW